MVDATDAQVVELEAAVEEDPGSAAFAALAELYRRSGRLVDAERVARQGLEHKPDSTAGRLVLSLALIDANRGAEARVEIERMAADAVAGEGIAQPAPLGPADPSDLEDGRAGIAAEVSDAEFERAFAEAEPDADEMIDPHRVVEQAVEHADAGFDDGAVEDPLGSGSAFETQTMAELLERQGDDAGAARIRAALDGVTLESLDAEASISGPTPARDSARRDSSRTIAILERWLENARRMQL